MLERPRMMDAGSGPSPASTPSPATPTFRIELRVPGETTHLRAPRLVAASTATMLGYDVDDLWEVRCAVDELCGILVKRGCRQLELLFEDDPSNGCLVVRGSGALGASRPGPNGDDSGDSDELDELALSIIEAVTETWSVEIDGAAASFAARFRPPTVAD